MVLDTHTISAAPLLLYPEIFAGIETEFKNHYRTIGHMSSCTMSFNVSQTNLVCCQKTTLFEIEYSYQCGSGFYQRSKISTFWSCIIITCPCLKCSSKHASSIGGFLNLLFLQRYRYDQKRQVTLFSQKTFPGFCGLLYDLLTNKMSLCKTEG